MKPGLDLESSDKLGLYQSNDLSNPLSIQSDREVCTYNTFAI